MSTLQMCNGPDCTVTSNESLVDAALEGWLTVIGRKERLDFHDWQCLRAYAEREVLR